MARKKLESVPKQRRTVNKHIELLPAASDSPAASESITPEVKLATEGLFPLGDQPTLGNLGTVDPAAPWPARGSVPVGGAESSPDPAPTEESSPDTAGGQAATGTWPARLKPARSSKGGKKDPAGDAGTMASALLTGTGKLPAGSYLESPVAAAPLVETEPAAPAPVTGFLGRYTDQEIIEEFQRRKLLPEGLATIPAMVAEMVKRLSFIPMSDLADEIPEIPEIPEDSLLKTTLLVKLQGEHDALMRLAGHRMGIIRTLKRDLKVGSKGRGPSENQKDLTRKAWDIAREKAKVSGLKAQAHMKEAWAELKAN
jgi:hypothetical protein